MKNYSDIWKFNIFLNDLNNTTIYDKIPTYPHSDQGYVNITYQSSTFTIWSKVNTNKIYIWNDNIKTETGFIYNINTSNPNDKKYDLDSSLDNEEWYTRQLKNLSSDDITPTEQVKTIFDIKIDVKYFIDNIIKYNSANQNTDVIIPDKHSLISPPPIDYSNYSSEEYPADQEKRDMWKNRLYFYIIKDGAVNDVPITDTVTYSGNTSSTIKLDDSYTFNNTTENYITIIEGHGVGQIRHITAYDTTTKIATIEDNWTKTPRSTYTYNIIPGYSSNTNEHNITAIIQNQDNIEIKYSEDEYEISYENIDYSEIYDSFPSDYKNIDRFLIIWWLLFN